MELKKIDINTVVVNGITYIAIEHPNCDYCELRMLPACMNMTCGRTCREDGRDVIWKRKTTNIQNKSSSEHTKSINIKVVNENKVIIDDVEYQSTDANGYADCDNCDLRHTRGCSKVIMHPGCRSITRADKRYVSWKKSNAKPSTTNKFTSINKKKTYKLNFKP